MRGIALVSVAGKSDAPVLEVVAGQVTDREVFLARVRKLYAQVDETSRDEIALKDGRTLDRYSAPVRLDDGTYLGRVWFFRDITERQRATGLLQASEERFRLLVEQAPDAIVLACHQNPKGAGALTPDGEKFKATEKKPPKAAQ